MTSASANCRSARPFRHSDAGAGKIPALGITVTPRAGDAILFDNLDSDGRAHPGAVHAGLPVRSGRKQVATRWIRQLPYDPWSR